MQQTIIALIRGINVGRAKRVAMADLRSLIEKLGYTDVRTLLNSGNVVLRAGDAPRKVASRIEQGIETELGVSARVTVLTTQELDRAIEQNPLLDVATDPSRLLVSVLADPSDRDKLTPLVDEDWSPEAIALGERVAYVWCPEGQLKSRLPELVGKRLGDGVTSRNWTTTLKLQALAQKT